VPQWWRHLVYDPYCHGNLTPMHDLLASLMWRTCKKDVLHQVGVAWVGKMDLQMCTFYLPLHGCHSEH